MSTVPLCQEHCTSLAFLHVYLWLWANWAKCGLQLLHQSYVVTTLLTQFSSSVGSQSQSQSLKHAVETPCTSLSTISLSTAGTVSRFTFQRIAQPWNWQKVLWQRLNTDTVQFWSWAEQNLYNLPSRGLKWESHKMVVKVVLQMELLWNLCSIYEGDHGQTNKQKWTNFFHKTARFPGSRLGEAAWLEWWRAWEVIRCCYTVTVLDICILVN